ncbi:MAG: bifunctional alpha,alpha-trehalose-phosphate synthase (UDP-forming)/trehalose-phosphatase [Cyclobacteriaceae bacterium]|nr:bifunctional alpha,alpha-trehalose-phosphate synthase (UDP-forming)/trehalose-phosphatase [Cyclobacteriaceae bacterium]
MNQCPRLIIVSNRLPIQLTERGDKISLRESSGGLVSAMRSFFDRSKSDGEYKEKIWIGSADFPEARWKKFVFRNTVSTSFTIDPIFLEAREYSKFYNGFCNATLWPLFHYFPSFVEFSDSTFKAYERVNQEFCKKISNVVQPGDTVWIHDYQLMLLPAMLREKHPEISIGYFHHIPFPSYEIFRMMNRPWRERIVSGLLGADVVGFHTDEYVQYFLDAVQKVLGIAHSFRTVQVSSRLVQAGVFPISIDYEKFHQARETKAIRVEREAIRKKFSNHKIIFSVDRLDYTKGITHRLFGFERFLEQHPEWQQKIVFILVVIPSRQIVSKYNERKKMIEEQVGQINGKYSTLQWQPILYRYNTLSFDELMALYQVADVALITPLRDGMNLVAKEFVASRKSQDGVLILSELAGSAHEMVEALLVNPTDKTAMAASIAEAMEMPLEEQKRRMQLLQDRIREYDVAFWVRSFIDALNSSKALQAERTQQVIDNRITVQWQEAFFKAKRRLLLMDYDGTLVSFNDRPEAALPPPELLSWFRALGECEQNHVVIISGRDYETLAKWFDGINLSIIAEHGACIRPGEAGMVRRKRLSRPIHPSVRSTLELFTKRCPGSFVEEKEFALAWHYRSVEPETGFNKSRELVDCLQHLIRNSTLSIVDGNKVIEVRQADINKGAAAAEFLDLQRADFVLAIGDDVTDEDMFESIRDRAITVKVGPGFSCAKYRLPESVSAFMFLQELTTQVHAQAQI